MDGLTLCSPKVFHNASAGQTRPGSVQAPTTKPTTPAPAGFRPAFFSQPSSSGSSSLSSVLAGKTPSSPTDPAPTSPIEAAFVANLASQTLYSRLGSAFMHAFAGTPPSSTATLDPRKVEAVLRGTSRVEVVPAEPLPSSAHDDLSVRMGNLNVAAPAANDTPAARCITSVLFGSGAASKRADS